MFTLNMRYGVKTVVNGKPLYLCTDATLGNKSEGARYDSIAAATRARDAYLVYTGSERQFDVCAMEAV